jgi:hypothetical protein
MRWQAAARGAAAALLPFLLAGCEYFVSDVATRIRYALMREAEALGAATGSTTTFTLRPDHWPDDCPGGSGYRLVLRPYAGGKQVAVGDILISCKDGRRGYGTGFGSERLYVAREISVEKKRDEDLRITLRRTETGIEIAALQ